MTKVLDHGQEKEIHDLLLFHSVAKISEDQLLLDDGTLLMIEPNDGCGGCPNGAYDITELNGCENVITSVETVSHDRELNDETTYSIFVYAENLKINLLSVSGSDGNGYYGTGYRIYVSRPNG